MSAGRDFDGEVRHAVYRYLADEARAPVATELAERLSASPLDIENALRRLHDEHLLVLAPGTPYIWMANPFSALPTPYRVSCAGKTYWANCVWDSLGIIVMLGSSGTVDTRCPDCADELQLKVENGAIVLSDHLIHFAVPAAKWWDDIGFN